MKNKRKHLGISMGLSIYHTRKNITWEELRKFSNQVIKMIERRNWYCGGGWNLTDVNSEGNMYIKTTPKHILDFSEPRKKYVKKKKSIKK